MLNRKALLILFFALTIFSINESFSQFGKNKVQYQDFDWKYIESKHFDVYYNKGSYYLAVFAAMEAEKALLSVQNSLNFIISNRIVIIVYDSHNEFQQTNVIGQFMPEGVGGVTELFKNRVVVPYQGDYSQFRHVIHHELTHAVINDMFYGGTFQSAISSGTEVQLPLWMNEGFAEFESIGGMDTQTDMFMRDLTISELLPPLEYLDGYLAYRGGQTFYWYVAENFGKERVGDLINRVKINFTLDGAFKSAFKDGLEEVSQNWQDYLKKYYWTDLDIFQRPKDFAVPLTDHKKENNFYNTSPAISPDGEKMAYISDREGIFKIIIQNIDDKKKSEELISSFREQDFEDLNILTPGISWSPDGKKLAISAKAGGEDAVFIVNVKTGDYSKLKFGIKSISSVVWSPDGKKLAFIGTAEDRSDIYVYRIQTEVLQDITDDYYTDMHPVWSYDSETLYFISDRGDDIKPAVSNVKIWKHDFDQSDIFNINITTKDIKRLTYDPDFNKTSIAITNDNTKLFFVSDKNGIGNIYQLDLKSGRVTAKTNSLNGITQISLNQDGSKLLFASQVNGGYDIFLVRYPLEKLNDLDSLPPTKFRKKWLEQRNMAQVAQNRKQDTVSASKPDINYGDFSVSFSNQQVIKPNYDAQSKNSQLTQEALKGESVSDSVFVEKSYKLKFTPDVVLGNPGYSTYWGLQGVTQMLFSDVLGDHQIFLQANLLLDLRNSSIFASYYYLPEVIDYQINAFHSSGFVYQYQDGSIIERPERTLFRFRNWGASVLASYPFDLFNRIEWGLNFFNVSKEDITNPSSGKNISRMLLVPEGKYVHDDVLYGNFAPVRGSRYYIGFKGVPKLSENGVGFMSFTGDFRHYFYFGDYLNLALRGTAGASFGPNPQKFFLGGTENWINPTFYDNTLPFDQPEDFAFMEFIMPLRGYNVNQSSGSKFFLANAELRFPLFRALLAGPVPILFQSIMGAFFYDIGGTWNNSFKATQLDANGNTIPNNLLMSAGIGVRTYLLGLPIKMDVAWRNEYYNWSQPEYLFSLGLDF